MIIPIVAGGNSLEREVSFRSAKNIEKSLNNLGFETKILDPIDKNFIYQITDYKFVFNIVHGDFGEDGRLPSLFELLGIDYTCSNPETSYITYDKYLFYLFFKESIKMPKTCLTSVFIDPPFELPLVIKPRKSGSSKGVFIIHNLEEYKLYLEKDLIEFGDVIIQEYIKGEEITISFIEDKEEFELLPLLRIIPKKEFYDYEAKYTNGLTDLKPWMDPPEKIRKQVHRIGEIITNSIFLKDMFRVDAIVKENEVYVLEVNTIPGMTDLSDLPTSAKAIGLEFEDIIKFILKNHSIFL
ncbi:ATP-grasp domain-containing protein [Defluviitoga tunisiensis]|uniref:D-alanine-D-alanine ligase n=1 Tax=Defluviitoga tunisiensis TaxID=1006576 RepID=A0A0C7NNT0_DEFTU|nr:ATP-grasp domain-containing protein [Defluviitoga tunisiensis]CEP77577.1 D-alanine-D-alanine ligase [Defluviitoga tunisiensis]